MDWEASALLSRVDNETLRCRSHIIKRVARHQSQLRIFSPMQHLNIIRIDNFRAVHAVSEDTVRSCQGDHVVGTNLEYRSKKLSRCAAIASIQLVTGRTVLGTTLAFMGIE